MKLSAPGLFASSSSKSASARKKSVRLQQQQQPPPPSASSNHSSSVRGDELAGAEQPAMRVSSTSASERTRPTTPSAASLSSASWSRKHRHSDSHTHAASTSSQQQTQQERARDHVVVGIAASLDDEVEDWTDDFMDSTRGSERQRLGAHSDRAGDLAQRFSSNFHHASSALHRATLRWNRQHSLDSNYSDMRATLKLQRNSRLRKSSGDMPPAAAATADAQLPRANRLNRLQPATHKEEDDDDDDDVKDDTTSSSNINRQQHDARRSDSLRSSSRSDRLASDSAPKSVSVSFDLDDEADQDDDDDDDNFDSEPSRPLATKDSGSANDSKSNDDDDDEDEDWDVEFGFAEASDDEQTDAALLGSASAIDSTRRRSENFNIFLRNFHDMMDGDALSDDDDDESSNHVDDPSAFQPARASKRAAKATEEPLFQRKRSEYHAGHSLDGSVDGTSRASLTSISGGVEYALVDKYRLVDVASSSAYAVRIERYPKPCTTFSNLERDVAGFPSFSENRLERWLASFVTTKCALATAVLERAREQMANPRQQKNHQFRTLVSLPFGKAFVVNCFKQVALYRYVGEEKSNRELVRVFFEKVSTTAYADGGDWAADVSPEDYHVMANYTMEILQEAARMFGPKPPAPHWSNTSSLSFSSTASHATTSSSASSSATLFWMRQFQSILLICAEAFPSYRHVIALIELRYVCHHLLGFASGDFTHAWQVCSQLPAFCPMELIAGDAAPNVANEILEYYGALFVHLNTSAESRTSWHESSSSVPPPPPVPTSDDDPATTASRRLREASFGISPDAICLQALVLCDLQCLYESRSVLAEVAIPELVELFEFEDDDMNIDPRLMELLETEVKVQSNVPGLYTGARSSSSGDEPQPRAPERRNSSSGLGGWSSEARLTALLKPSSSSRLSALAFFYDRIATLEHPLVKAKCALVLGSMHHHAGSLANLRAAESLTYEAVRILEVCSSKKLEPFASGSDPPDALCLSMCSNDGLLSELGREALEQLGNVLIKNQKYRYGVLALEAASALFGFLNQGSAYEKMDRLLCRLTLEADDVARALPLHEKVAASAQRQGNITEFIYLTQALTNLWVREGAFARAEANLLAAFRFLREHTSVLPPSFLAFVYSSSSYAGSDGATSSRSGTMMTASTSTSSSLSGSFHLAAPPASRSHTSELDAWLNHDVSLHLLVRDVYRSSGRCLEGMHVLHYALSYSSRLPRGKRTQLQMLVAEDALKLSLLAMCRQTFAFLDHEANLFCERLKENIVSSTIGSSSGTGTGTGNGSSSGGGRSMGGLGSEARYCFDMVFSMRYVLCRAKCHLKAREFRDAYTWLSLAHVKSDKENVRKQAQLHVLDGKVLFGLYREFFEQRRRSASATAQAAMAAPEAVAAQTAAIAAEVDDTVTAFAGSFYGLSTKEKSVLTTRLATFCACAQSAETTMETGVKALWTAFDQFQALDDGLHQLKALLEIVTFSLAPIEQSFFALGSNADDDLLKAHLYRGSASFKTQASDRASRSSSNLPVTPTGDNSLASPLSDDDVIEKTRRSVLDAQKLLRRAMHLAEQVADPASLLRTLIFCSEAWLWLERIASYKNDKAVKEAAAFWEEAVRLLQAVFLRRVAFQSVDDSSASGAARYYAAYSPSAGTAMALAAAESTYCVVPILNFSEGVIVRLERMTLQLIYIACQLQHLERVPEYVEEMLSVHLDELLSAKLCLSTVAQQLAAFRDHQRPQHKRAAQSSTTSVGSAGAAAATPRSSVSAVSSDGSTRAASFSSSNSTPALHSGGGTPSSSSAAKRKGHKKNQSMSSISELLASSGSPTPSTSFHDISSSFSGASGNRSGSFLSASTTPRTGLASLNERVAAPPHAKGYAATTGIHPPLMLRPLRTHGYERSVLRARGRSSSAPQPLVPTPSSRSGVRSPFSAEPLEVLTPVHESESHARRRIVDLADVGSWSRDDLSGLSASDAQRGGYSSAQRGDSSSSTGVVGAFDCDEVQSERLWWIFNMWRDAKTKYTSGKLESSAFRTQNLRYLRTLLDTFEPHQVAVLYVNGLGSASVTPTNAVASSKGAPVASSSGIVGYDVAHIHSYALLQEHDLVLSIGYDLDKAASAPQLSLTSSTASSFAYAQLKFKVFRVKDGETRAWRSEIPRPDWYLRHYDLVEAESASSGAGALRTLRLLGPKLLVKLVGLLLLENAVVVTGASFPQVQEVTLSLLKLLQPFQWPHTFVPFVPSTSWRFLYDSLQLFATAQQAARPKSRKSFSRLSAEWRWGGGSSSAPSSTSSASLSNMVDAVESDEPPFLLGATTETWQACMLRARGDDTARTIAAHVTVVDLASLETFAIAKSSLNAVSLPRKWRKHFLERFDKVVKQRRKVQQKATRRLARQSRVPSTPGGALSSTSTPYGGGPASSSYVAQSPVSSDDAYRHIDMLQRSYDDGYCSSSRSASSLWMSQSEAGLGAGSQGFVASVLSADAAAAAGAGALSDRLVYDAECFGAFVTGLHDFFDKVRSICDEKDKKLKGSSSSSGKKTKTSGLSKRQEIKAWFSSSHDFDAFADKFHETEVYLQYQKDAARRAAATEQPAPSSRRSNGLTTASSVFALLSVGSTGSGSASQTLASGNGSSSQLSRQLRSAGSLSSTSSAGVASLGL